MLSLLAVFLFAPILQTGSSFLSIAIAFLVLAVIAYVVGARGIAGLSMEIARILVLIFLVLFVVSLLWNFLG